MIPINSFNGVVDEVRLANGALSAEWIKTTYLSESDALLSYGSPEGRDSGTVITLR